MMITVYAATLGDMSTVMREHLKGVITTGIAPGSDGRTTPATSPSSSDDPPTRGNLLSRVWRFPARLSARPKAAAGGTC
jgi:hypothetical protein